MLIAFRKALKVVISSYGSVRYYQCVSFRVCLRMVSFCVCIKTMNLFVRTVRRQPLHTGLRKAEGEILLIYSVAADEAYLLKSKELFALWL